MKKVLSAVLAGTMAVSMGFSAFAAEADDIVKGFAPGYDMDDVVATATWGTETIQSMNSTKKLDLKAKFFSTETVGNMNTVVNEDDVDYLVLNWETINKHAGGTFSNLNDLAAALKASGHDDAAAIVADAAKDGRVTFHEAHLIMEAILKCHDEDHVDFCWCDFDFAGQRPVWKNGCPAVKVVEDQYQKNVIYIYNNNLQDGLMTVEDNDVQIVDRNLTQKEIRENKITLFADVKKDDAGLIKSIELDESAGQIVVKFITRLVSVDDHDYAIELGLLFDGKKADTARVEGNISNEVIEVYGDDNKVDISKGYVVDPQEFNKSIALYVGEGVTVHTKLWEGKKYYCVADRDADDADERVMTEYADVDNVVTLYRVGVNNSGDYVTFSNDYADYFVYGYEDGALEFLGMGDEDIAAYGDNTESYTKYYFANKELVLDNAADAEPDAEPDAEAPTTSTNNNANPGTGR